MLIYLGYTVASHTRLINPTSGSINQSVQRLSPTTHDDLLKTRQDKTRQDKTRQDKTRQDWIGWIGWIG